MISKMCRIVLIGFLSLMATNAAHADGISFSLLPGSGDISGTAGSTIGWGYTVTDTSTTGETLSLTGINAGTFLYGSFDPSLFAYDYLNPGETDTWIFDPSIFSGLAAFTIDPSAPTGLIDSGDFTISYDLCGSAGCSSSSILVPYSVSVNAIATPETSTVTLLCMGLALCWLLRRRERTV